MNLFLPHGSSCRCLTGSRPSPSDLNVPEVMLTLEARAATSPVMATAIRTRKGWLKEGSGAPIRGGAARNPLWPNPDKKLLVRLSAEMVGDNVLAPNS